MTLPEHVDAVVADTEQTLKLHGLPTNAITTYVEEHEDEPDLHIVRVTFRTEDGDRVGTELPIPDETEDERWAGRMHAQSLIEHQLERIANEAIADPAG